MLTLDMINLRFAMPWLGSSASNAELHPHNLCRKVSLPKFSLGLSETLTPIFRMTQWTALTSHKKETNPET